MSQAINLNDRVIMHISKDLAKRVNYGIGYAVNMYEEPHGGPHPILVGGQFHEVLRALGVDVGVGFIANVAPVVRVGV